MHREPFWYLDDDHRVRWAVRVSRAAPDATIVFTSADQQISTLYGLEKEQSELSRYELLELLTRARLEAFSRSEALPAASEAAAA